MKDAHDNKSTKKEPYCPECDEPHEPCSVYWVHVARGDYDSYDDE